MAKITIADLRDTHPLFKFSGPEGEQNFTDLLDTINKIDIWRDVDLGEISVKAQSEVESSEETKASETGLFLSIDDEEYPILSEALYSVKRRAKNTAEILSHMGPKAQAQMLNLSWPYRSGDTGKMLVRAGNLLSLNSPRYVPIAQADIYRHFRGSMQLDYENIKFIIATYTHGITSATYQILDPKLGKGYAKALKDSGASISPSDIKFYITLNTGDAAGCAIGVHPEIACRGTEVPFARPLKVEHKDNVTIHDVDATFRQIYSVINEASECLEKMLKIELTYPSSVIMRIVKKFKLPLKLVRPLAPHFAYEKYGQKMNAHDFYLEASRILEDDRFLNKPITDQMLIKDSLSKILVLDEAEWKKLDRPGETLCD